MRYNDRGFRAVLFRMVPKLYQVVSLREQRFRAVLFRMVPKPTKQENRLTVWF